ncbi:hypothetical protein EBF03_07365 [Arcanobacterium haemolyticum]|uniref:Uncharacterized protein n=1 Tax=Arcanobacterium haemolyticum (strain ATCC 9345 / DSM 20595 / CCM 5947 / CCUG 17215 / LMG 16163 / NBRC 15585 / NCTC 8452 / 11018) TaxID=644284 RepID=D7BKL9_ARCHD|nr:hypothetical protein [Arcanobacterium haemolyticum]ADH93199.1 hypothetical protein Arch_1498 [Arcanobacterium haemolyticum DSM 20595]QCX47245.1 hypothetical protein EBF03_07365 [Arcanobacterium haemolyticum]SQH28042.1 Uncharacterised protein [Arcanobacterium haemolyticum]
MVYQPKQLRSCVRRNEPLGWIHPGHHFDGKIHGSHQDWLDMPTWLGSDIAGLRESVFHGNFQYIQLIGEINELLQCASYGELTQEYPDDVVRSSKDVVPTRREPNVIELRLPEPFDVEKKRYRSRVYFAEPMIIDALVSLGHLMKDVDSQMWREEQDRKIDDCARRLESWVKKPTCPSAQ